MKGIFIAGYDLNGRLSYGTFSTPSPRVPRPTSLTVVVPTWLAHVETHSDHCKQKLISYSTLPSISNGIMACQFETVTVWIYKAHSRDLTDDISLMCDWHVWLTIRHYIEKGLKCEAPCYVMCCSGTQMWHCISLLPFVEILDNGIRLYKDAHPTMWARKLHSFLYATPIE